MMRVVENSTERLVLKGTPGSVRWMAFATLLGAAIMVATGWFAWATVEETGGDLQLIPLGAGFLMGLAMFVMGLVTLAVGRMRLVFDRGMGEGQYDVYSPIVEVGKPCTFRLESIDRVTLERRQEARPKNDQRDRFDAQVCRARLHIRYPRRAIVLDDTENGQDDRVQKVAEAVGDWLGMQVDARG